MVGKKREAVFKENQLKVTPLDIACEQGHIQIVKDLLSNQENIKM